MIIQTWYPTCDASASYNVALGLLIELCSSFLTVAAALVPSSMAPSMKLRQPRAQSELANSTFPCRARIASR